MENFIWTLLEWTSLGRLAVHWHRLCHAPLCRHRPSTTARRKWGAGAMLWALSRGAKCTAADCAEYPPRPAGLPHPNGSWFSYAANEQT